MLKIQVTLTLKFILQQYMQNEGNCNRIENVEYDKDINEETKKELWRGDTSMFICLP